MSSPFIFKMRWSMLLLYVACKPKPEAQLDAAQEATTIVQAPVKVDPVVESLAFLAALDKLMDGFVPSVPSTRDNTNLLRCVTTRALHDDPALRAAGQKLVSRREKALKEREKRVQELYVLSFRIDSDWQTKKLSIAEVKSCWADGVLQYDECCEPGGECGAGGWHIDVPAELRYVYSQSKDPPTQRPELMARIESAKLKVPERFSCVVDDVNTETMTTLVASGAADVFVQKNQAFAVVDCVAPNDIDVALRITGDVHSLNAGDTVSLPIANAHRPEGVLLKTVGDRKLRWTIDGDITELKVDQPAVCPSVEEITAAAKR